jgi:anhydro-N-acetylmuramic acid kinase
VAILDIRGTRFKVLVYETTPYPRKIREALLGVSNCITHTAKISDLNFQLPELYAAAVRRIWKKPLDLVGCHGQTIYHSKVSTLQIGDGPVLAERLGAPVVSNFRTRDMAAGGQGAPLVPFMDYRLFRHRTRGRVALNLGGIANITAIPPSAKPNQVLAFDTGPSNMVIDTLVEQHTNGRQGYDRDGGLASQGCIDQALLGKLMSDPYLRRKPPKSAGREQYGAEFVAQFQKARGTMPDKIATATAFTAASVAAGIERFVRPMMPVHDLIAAGGGVHNRILMAYLAAFLPGVRIRTTADFGIDPDAKEAVAFAIMAAETFRGRPSNLPSATGARRLAVLGEISPQNQTNGD